MDDEAAEASDAADPEAAAALAKRIGRAGDAEELKQLVGRRELALGRSATAIAEEFGWPVATVERWARRSRVGAGDSPVEEPAKDGPGGIINGTAIRTLAIVLLLGLLLLTFLQPGILLGARSTAVGVYADVVADPVPAGSEAPIQVSETDVTYLNRIFAEQDVEVGYCGLIDTDRQMRPWLATLGDATVSAVELSVRNCPTGAYPMLALLHTHPNGDPRLTPADRRVLGVADVDFLCIQHGEIVAESGEATRNLRCYSETGTATGDASVERVPVRVGTQGGG